jgi:hypothetical protein
LFDVHNFFVRYLQLAVSHGAGWAARGEPENTRRFAIREFIDLSGEGVFRLLRFAWKILPPAN